MKPLNILEVENLVELLSEEMIWAQLQDLWSYDKGLVLQFWKNSEKFIVIDMSSEWPFVGLFDYAPVKKGKVKKPAELFLRAHGRNLFAKKIEIVASLGRYIRFSLGARNEGLVECILEISLIPRGGENVIVYSQGKKSFWKRPQEISEMSSNVDLSQLEVRSLPELHRVWIQKQQKAPLNKKNGFGLIPKGLSFPTKVGGFPEELSAKQKMILKKKQALQKMEADSSRFTKSYAALGAEIKNRVHEPFSLAEFSELLSEYKLETAVELPKDKKKLEKKDLLRLMQVVFEKDREQTKKLEASLKRKELLQKEIQKLESTSEQEFQKSRVQGLGQVEDLKVRKLELESGPIAYFGKSAEDNLKLLREARAWDFWLHLVDYPSRHVIVRRNKNQSLNPSEMDQICRRLLEETRGKDKLGQGEKYEILLTECRYVRPVKGPQNKGKVLYSHEKRIQFVYR